LKIALERKVAFVPGAAFHTTQTGANTMRLNFSYANPDTIREGITRLGITLKELLHEGEKVGAR
jgi:2-aminoadipate transaminase